MRTPESSRAVVGGVSRGTTWATIVAILLCAQLARAEEGGRIRLARDGKSVDIRAEERKCFVSGPDDRRDLEVSNGAFLMRGIGSGELIRLSLGRSTAGEARTGWTEFLVKDLSKDVLLECLGGPIAASVQTARGEPAPDVAVCLMSTRPDLPENVASMQVLRRSRTDAAGRCEFQDVPYGEYSLSVSPDGGQGGVYRAGSFEFVAGEDGQVEVRRDGPPQEARLRLRTLTPRLRFASPVLVEVRVQEYGKERGLSIKGRVGPGEPWDCLLPDGEALELTITSTLPEGGRFITWRRLGKGDAPLGIELPAVHLAPSVEIEVPGADSLPAEARWSIWITHEHSAESTDQFERPFLTESSFALPASGRVIVPHVLPGRYIVWLEPTLDGGKEDQWNAWSQEYGRMQSFQIDEGVHHIVLERE
ncbi:MAG: carboxypeptidase-like regulatory domain-containing protein [Planctomycetota bacterium]